MRVTRSGPAWRSGLVLLQLCVASAALAQNRGVYPLGMTALGSGVIPEPGFTYGNQLLIYARDESKDASGQTIATGSQSVIMDLNTVTWRSPWMINGLLYMAAVTLPVAKNDLTSDTHGHVSGGGGFADSFYLPAILAWSARHGSARFQYGFLAPTGKFAAGASDNVGSGYWTHTLSSGQTFRLGASERWTLSAFEMYEWHTEQDGTGVRPGDTFDLDGSLLYALNGGAGARWHAGLAGYLARQASDHEGGAALAPPGRYAVNALGVAVSGSLPRWRASVGLKLLTEFENRSTYQGHSIQVAGAIAL